MAQKSEKGKEKEIAGDGVRMPGERCLKAEDIDHLYSYAVFGNCNSIFN